MRTLSFKIRRRWLVCLLLVHATACSPATSILDPRGPAAAHIADLWWLMLALAATVFVAVMTLLLLQLRQRKKDAPRPARLLGISIGVSAIILTSVFIASERTMALLHHEPQPEDLRIHVTGWQWWWQVAYIVQGTTDTVVAANEIHIPTGRPVHITVTSGDVIHSLWVPNLHGKIDLVPGRSHTLTVQADRPGISRGPCAEYCGVQHAHMTLLVIARAPADFDAWLARERLPAAAATDSIQLAGAATFARTGCAYCHRVRGTNSLGKLGPDLTHFASRHEIAAGTLENTAEHVASWVADPERVKPGTRMPAVPLSPGDVAALVAYLSVLR